LFGQGAADVLACIDHLIRLGLAGGVTSIVTEASTLHSQNEERWFTLGLSSEGTLLAVAHTYQSTDAGLEQVRIISARIATRRERQQYETEPR